MLPSILASAAAYAVTNIDDIFILMLLFSGICSRARITAGHCLGVAALTVLSLLGALGFSALPMKYTGLLGLVPIALGIRNILARPDDDQDTPGTPVSLAGMALITLGNGADNLGVYIPLFTGFSALQRLSAVIVFALMTLAWLYLARSISALPRVQGFLRRYGRILTPAVLILLGVFIILDSGLAG